MLRFTLTNLELEVGLSLQEVVPLLLDFGDLALELSDYIFVLLDFPLQLMLAVLLISRCIDR